MNRILNWVELLFVWPVLIYRKYTDKWPYRRIYLGEGLWAKVSVMDYFRLRKYRWYLSGNKSSIYAARSKLVGRTKTVLVKMHREIMGEPKGLIVDHRNRNGLDNRRENLRTATHSENAWNRSKVKTKTSSRYVGASFRKSAERWAGVITHQGKKIFLGYFDSEDAAARAYDRAAIKYRGEFARLNFPREDYIDEFPLTK